jgi:hypothetical protein
MSADGLPDPRILSRFDCWLHWDGKRGIARHEGHEAPLPQAPLIARGKLLRSVYYAPQARHCRIRFSGEAERDMTDHECDVALALLDRLRAAASFAVTVPGDL